jgi:hypothetical protein
MDRIAACLIIIIGTVGPSMVFAAEEQPRQPSAKERLNQVLDTEGGTTVYKNHNGNVETVIELPNGERRTVVQPPQSPGLNLGPPLQLNNRTLTFPSPPPPPGQPPAPDFPQRAR